MGPGEVPRAEDEAARALLCLLKQPDPVLCQVLSVTVHAQDPRPARPTGPLLKLHTHKGKPSLQRPPFPHILRVAQHSAALHALRLPGSDDGTDSENAENGTAADASTTTNE